MTSILPNSASAKSAKAFHVLEVDDVERAEPSGAAGAFDVARDGLEPVRAAPAKHDTGAVRRENARRPLADAA
jgi:hypothetical protein